VKRTTIFIIEKEAPVANLIRYYLLSHQAKHVQVFPTPAECLYFMHKKSIPDFLIANVSHPEINATGFLKSVLQFFPGVKILFLSPFTDDSLVTRLMEEGATDYIYKSDRMEDWIHELVMNMEFLLREKSRAN
jgi:DNA-binding NarL/FixJ family response regulator